MWSITPLAPTLQQVVDEGADTRQKREEYTAEMGKIEEHRDLARRRKGKRVEYLLVLYSTKTLQFSESFFYQFLHYVIVSAAFVTIAFAVNGSVSTDREEDIYNACNIVIDTCFILHGTVKLISVYSYAKRLRNYDELNVSMGADEAGHDVPKKFLPSKIFKNSGVVDCFIAIFCLVFNGTKVADWFRLIRIVIISLWALENEPRIAILLSGIAHGIKAMASLLMLMLLINVIYAAVAVSTFGENDPYHFASMSIAIWTLFEMSTMEGWSEVLAINQEGCDSVPDSNYEMRTNSSQLSIDRAGGEFSLPVCSDPKAQPFAATFIFLSYIVIVGFILTSITIGAISAGINERFDDLKSNQHNLELVEESDGGDDKDEASRHAPGQLSRSYSMDSSTLDNAEPDNVSHSRIYSESMEETFSFSNKSRSASLTIKDDDDNNDNIELQDLDSFSDAPTKEGNDSNKPRRLKYTSTKSNLGRLKYKSTKSGLDQFSFRTVKSDDEGNAAERDQEYEIFSAEVHECIDMIHLERSTNEIKKPLRHSTSNMHLRQELARTITALQRTDERNNEMKSRNLRILFYKFKKFIYGDTYGLLMMMFILLAALFEIFTLSNPRENLDDSNASVYKIQLTIQLIFSLDMVLRFLALFPRQHQFLIYQWNMFDFVIVTALWLPFVIDILDKYLRLLRVLRLVALIKFMKWIPQLAYILDAIVSSINLLLYTVLLMGMGFYYFAVAGVLLFKDNDVVNFGKLHTSFLTMVSVATFDNWSETCRTNMYGCDILGYSTGDDAYDAQCTSPDGLGWWASLFFFVFILLENYMLINLLISIIMTSMEISYKNSKDVDKMWERIQEKKRKHKMSNVLTKKMLAIFVILDFNANCAMSLSAATPIFELMSITEHSEVVSIFNQIDEDKLGSIDFPEFIELMFYLENRKNEKGKE